MAVTQFPTWTLGDRLRKARLTAGIKSHKDMAKRLGVSEDTVKRWEGDKYAPTRGYVLGWATVCGIDPAWLEGSVQGGDGAITAPVHLHTTRGFAGLTTNSYIETVSAA